MLHQAPVDCTKLVTKVQWRHVAGFLTRKFTLSPTAVNYRCHTVTLENWYNKLKLFICQKKGWKDFQRFTTNVGCSPSVIAEVGVSCVQSLCSSVRNLSAAPNNCPKCFPGCMAASRTLSSVMLNLPPPPSLSSPLLLQPQCWLTPYCIHL